MKINSHRLLLVPLFITLSPALFAAESIVSSESGITLTQLDFPEQSEVIIDSSIGMLDANLIQLRLDTGIASGFINMVYGGEWLVRNLPVLPEADYPYSDLSVRFDLGVAEGVDVTSLDVLLHYSETLSVLMPTGSSSVFPVSSQSVVQGGSFDVMSGASEPGASTSAPVMAGISFGDPTNNRQAFQLDHPNLESAANQCFPMSVANSLQFLVNTTQLKLPHNHVAGLEGDASLVGQLGSKMGRTSTSRRNGSGTFIDKGIKGKLTYLAENDLHERIKTRHWGVSGAQDFSVTVGDNTATSKGQGKPINFDKVVDALVGAQDCEADYIYPTRNGFGGHAVDLVAAGYIAGQPFIIENSDLNQSSDTLGAGKTGFLFSFLKDTDNDGLLNMNGSTQQLRFVMCQEFVPEPKPSESSIPLPDTYYYIPGAGLKIDKLTDPAGHSCCAEFPPSSLNMEFENGLFTVNADGSTVPWLPMILTLDSEGGLKGSNTANVAGFSNISNSIVGTLGPDGITAQISLGDNGGLPQGEAIKFDVTITPDEPFAWLFAEPDPVLTPAIRLNGFRAAHTVAVGDPLSIGVSLKQGDEAGNLEWWLIAEVNGALYSYNALSLSWVPGVVPTLTAPTTAVESFTVHTFPGGQLPAGEYIFYFGLDSMPNGEVNLEALIYDTVTLTVVDEP